MLKRFIALIPLLCFSAIAPASANEIQTPPNSEQLLIPLEVDLATLFRIPEDPTLVAARGITSVAKALDPAVALRAIQSAHCAFEHGLTVETLIVIDMGAGASEKRLWAFDVSDPEAPVLLLNDRVAHGSGSDPEARGIARRFSNTPNSHMTSLGLYRVAERYQGKHGWSRRLDGLMAGFNTKARDRAVVMHPSNYVSEQRVGRSQGCPAVNQVAMNALEAGGLTNAVIWIDGPDEALSKAVEACSKARQEALFAAARQAHYDRAAAQFAASPSFNVPFFSLPLISQAMGHDSSEICLPEPDNVARAWRRRERLIDIEASGARFS